jgi:hypothetical protein
MTETLIIRDRLMRVKYTHLFNMFHKTQEPLQANEDLKKQLKWWVIYSRFDEEWKVMEKEPKRTRE